MAPEARSVPRRRRPAREVESYRSEWSILATNGLTSDVPELTKSPGPRSFIFPTDRLVYTGRSSQYCCEPIGYLPLSPIGRMISKIGCIGRRFFGHTEGRIEASQDDTQG